MKRKVWLDSHQSMHRGGVKQVCLWITAILLLCNNICRGQDDTSRTFLGAGSYAVFPRWIATTQGLAELSFITSAPSGLLLYIDSMESSGDYLLLLLENGSVTVEVRVGGSAELLSPVVLEGRIGEHLHDNQLHSIRIQHIDSLFIFILDGNSPSELELEFQYPQDLFLDTRGQVFSGGIPESYVPDAQFDTSLNFIGCLQDIQFVNNSFFSLQFLQPLEESGVMPGCVDPCSNVSCNGGECVPQWPTSETAFCDCRNTGRAGPTCSDDPTAHQLMNGAVRNYSCYSLPTDQPFTDEPTNAMIQLAPPIPSSGTILTGLGLSADNSPGFFALFLRDSKVFLQFNNMSEIKVSPTLTQEFRYRIGYLQLPTHVVINVNQVSANNVLTPVDERNITLPLQQYDFRNICIGGALLEVVNYVGTFEYVFFRRYALIEQQNFARFNREAVISSDVIRFVEDTDEPSLAFENYGLGSQKISFEFRNQPGEDSQFGGGILLYSENDTYLFALSLFNGDFLVIASSHSDTLNTIIEFCNFSGLGNGSWYQVVLETFIEVEDRSPRISLTVNDDWICEIAINSSKLEEILKSLDSSPLEFGRTRSMLTFASGIPFVGCMQNIVFGLGEDSFRPNLEAVAKIEERFEIDGCFFCNAAEDQMLSCQNGGSCSSRGVRQLKCDCPDNFTGSSCEDPEFSPTAATSSSASPSPTSTVILMVITDPTPASSKIGLWVGVAVGITLVLALTLLTTTFLYVFCCGRFRTEGFYKTNENRGSEVALPRYSASLKRVSSQRVTLERNGTVHNRTPTEQDQDKEFFM